MTASDWADQTDADEKLGRSDKRGFYRTTMRRIHGCLSTLEQAGVDHHALKTALYLIEAMEGGYGIGQSDMSREAQQTVRPTTVQANPLYQPTLPSLLQQQQRTTTGVQSTAQQMQQTTRTVSYAEVAKSNYFPSSPSEQIPWTMISRQQRPKPAYCRGPDDEAGSRREETPVTSLQEA